MNIRASKDLKAELERLAGEYLQAESQDLARRLQEAIDCELPNKRLEQRAQLRDRVLDALAYVPPQSKTRDALLPGAKLAEGLRAWALSAPLEFWRKYAAASASDPERATQGLLETLERVQSAATDAVTPRKGIKPSTAEKRIVRALVCWWHETHGSTPPRSVNPELDFVRVLFAVLDECGITPDGKRPSRHLPPALRFPSTRRSGSRNLLRLIEEACDELESERASPAEIKST